MPTITITQLMKTHADTLENDGELDGICSLPPAEFINELDSAAAAWGTSVLSSLQDAAEELAAAVTYLRDALPLSDNDHEKQTLLRKADRHLRDLDVYL